MSTRENGFEFLFFYKLSTLSLQFARENDLKSLVLYLLKYAFSVTFINANYYHHTFMCHFVVFVHKIGLKMEK